jgi:hypothetical protein
LFILGLKGLTIERKDQRTLKRGEAFQLWAMARFPSTLLPVEQDAIGAQGA